MSVHYDQRSTLGFIHLKDRLRLLRSFRHQEASHKKTADETASQTSASKEGRGVTSSPDSDTIRAGEVELDRAHYEVHLPDKIVSLTSTEFEILAKLMSQPSFITSSIEVGLAWNRHLKQIVS